MSNFRERPLDVLFVTPDSSTAAYQALSEIYSAIEPPTWSLLLAQSCRAKGFGVAILDCTAERLTDEQAIQRVRDAGPRLVCFVLYGQNPNSGTTNMIGAMRMAAKLKEAHPEYPLCFVGSHVSALPKDVLKKSFVDIVLLNEGVYALHNLLLTDLRTDLHKVKGIGYKKEDQMILNPPQKIVPQELMDQDLPGYAWDLLPKKRQPLDLYRSHFWHAEFNHNLRSPFAALYTSLGCPFKCDFCMINILNRTNHSDGVVAADSAIMRFWSADFILNEFDKLADLGIETVRISDEMFFLNSRHYEPLLEGLIQRGHKFRMWSYSRIDTVREQFLERFLRAGINWLAVGIEAGNSNIRLEISKGKFTESNIHQAVGKLKSYGIHVLGNYIFGLPDDNLETMTQTLNLAIELNTIHANFYPCIALPGSPLYEVCLKKGWKLPDSYEGFAFLSYESEPMPTKYLSAAEVLRFRDHAWHQYFSRPEYCDLVERTFGEEQRRNIEEMTKIRLKRRLLGD